MIRHWTIAGLAGIGALLAARVSFASTLIVDDDGRQCPGAFYRTITAAVDAASDIVVIHVCPGTYAEQVVVTKSLRLLGDDGTVIRPGPLAISASSVAGGRPVTAGIIIDAPRTFLRNLTVDLTGSEVSGCTLLLAGIYLRNASGVVDHVHVTGVRLPDAPTCDSGVALFVESGIIGELEN